MNRPILSCASWGVILLFVANVKADNEYMVEKGDTLYGIGKLLGVPYEEIIKANNLKNDTIYPDQILRIPTAGRVSDRDPAMKPATVAKKAPSRTAARPSVATLVHGGVVPSDKPLEMSLSPGGNHQSAFVPPVQGRTRMVSASVPVDPVTYKVVEGDTIYGISKRFGVSAWDLRKLNNIPYSAIFPGQVLVIPGKTEVASVASF